MVGAGIDVGGRSRRASGTRVDFEEKLDLEVAAVRLGEPTKEGDEGYMGRIRGRENKVRARGREVRVVDGADARAAISAYDLRVFLWFLPERLAGPSPTGPSGAWRSVEGHALAWSVWRPGKHKHTRTR